MPQPLKLQSLLRLHLIPVRCGRGRALDVRATCRTLTVSFRKKVLFGGQASQSGARISAALSSRCCSQIQCGVACRAFPCAPALCRGLWPQSVHMSLGSLKTE